MTTTQNGAPAFTLNRSGKHYDVLVTALEPGMVDGSGNEVVAVRKGRAQSFNTLDGFRLVEDVIEVELRPSRRNRRNGRVIDVVSFPATHRYVGIRIDSVRKEGV